MKAKRILLLQVIFQLAYALEFLNNYPHPIEAVAGIGGERLKKWGMNITVGHKNLSVIGFTQVLKRLFFLNVFKQTLLDIQTFKPDFILLIDFPGFNVRLAKKLIQVNIPIYYYVPPQLFAWRQGRIHTLAKAIDQIFYFYPFEKNALTHPQLKITRVRQPLIDDIKPIEHSGKIKTIFLLPGSRSGELKMHIPLLEEVREHLIIQGYDVKYCIGQNHNYQLAMKLGVKEELITNIPVKELNCDFVICASGTVTLELALRNIPHLVIYKTGLINFYIIKSMIKIPYVSLPNLIANQHVVPELLGPYLTPDTIKNCFEKIDIEQVAQQLSSFTQIRATLDEAKPLADHLADLS